MKQQFDLLLWLKDKSRKVCTRGGRPVRIICTDGNDKEQPICGFIGDELDVETWCVDGRYFTNCNDTNDLFFADEEEEMTEFEKELERIMVSFSNSNRNSDVRTNMDRTKLHSFADRLLDLARNQIRKEEQEKLGTLEMPIDELNPHYIAGRNATMKELCLTCKEHSRGYQEGLKNGEIEALKSLPKWKKATEDKEFDTHIFLFKDEKWAVLTTVIHKGDYYIKLSDLKTLPKEE